MPSDCLNYPSLRHFFPFHVPLMGVSPQRQLQQQLLALLTAANLLNVSLPKAISLKRLPQTNIIYRWAIAFQLSSRLSIAPITLAEKIFLRLTTIRTADDNFPQLFLTVHLLAAGWIDFHLNDRSLAIWLQFLPQQLESQNLLLYKSEKLVNTEQFWRLQSTHARCCSLLRLGQQENLIKLKTTEFKDLSWQWETPQPIPWINETLGQIQFKLKHPAERSLIAQILITVDCLESSQSANWVKLATNLSQTFWIFERECRIFGEVAQNTPLIAQARLGLLAIVQILLQKMYNEGKNRLLLAQL